MASTRAKPKDGVRFVPQHRLFLRRSLSSIEISPIRCRRAELEKKLILVSLNSLMCEGWDEGTGTGAKGYQGERNKCDSKSII